MRAAVQNLARHVPNGRAFDLAGSRSTRADRLLAQSRPSLMRSQKLHCAMLSINGLAVSGLTGKWPIQQSMSLDSDSSTGRLLSPMIAARAMSLSFVRSSRMH
ncbi:hypothetical protein WS67_19520 [Burkholderia singularis]|uniref:Uncharacterized protein n=1 Tax=Burkholderia singularis TaxID=1503053 RepID=A0A103DYH9_9BURK|nr:hypothetical protein WS67_19520 [Burkholderia singularis]